MLFGVFLNCRQCSKESLQDCTKCFKVSKQILDSYLGSLIMIKKIIKNYPDFDKTDQVVVNKLTEEVDEHFTTCIYLENSDQAKHGSVLKG